MLENWRYDLSLIGETKNRERVLIKDIYVSRNSLLGATLDVTFLAMKVEVCYETISTKDQLLIEYGIINFDLSRVLRGHIETDIGKITFAPLEDHEEIIEEMYIFKVPLLSGFIGITTANIEKFKSFDSYFNTVNKTIDKVIELLSLAKSTYLSHCLIRIYAKTPKSNIQDDYKLKKLIMMDAKTKAPSLGQPLIEDVVDIYKFISTTLPKYTDDLRKDFDLDIALEWYLNSLSSADIQSGYIQAFTVLELLKDRYNKKIKKEYIIDESVFEECFSDLKDNINGVLKEKGLNSKKRKKISGNLKCINRPIFENGLKKFIKKYPAPYKDLVLVCKDLKDMRDQITHTGIQEKENEELFKIYGKLICLIQRIFLALLEYDGYFLDRNDGYRRKKFTDFISGEFGQTSQEIPRVENGAR